MLIIEKGQLGMLVDVEEWCRCLKQDYDITFVGYSFGYPQSILSNEIRECYISTRLPRFIRGSLFILFGIIIALFHKGPIIVVHFPKCKYIKKFLPWKRMNLDIRTMSIDKNLQKRERYDADLKECCKLYNSVSVISDGIANKLNLTDYFLLPLGSDQISNTRKDYNSKISLLYVGTFNGRNLADTIYGLKDFLDSNANIPISYTIIGSGRAYECAKIEVAVKDTSLYDIVKLEGRISHNLLKDYFDKANVGVSFVPMTDYYDNQPPTKTYEYINSGLFCIATKTSSNKSIITSQNGILIDDNADSFKKALEEYWEGRSLIDQAKVEAFVSTTNWGYIVNNYLKRIIQA